MRIYRIGRYVVPLWLVVIILAAVFGSVLGYVFWTMNVNVHVQEPLGVYYFASDLNLFPGETQQLQVDLENFASVNYTVTLEFHLSDANYQSSYATFSNDTYVVVPGIQSLKAWIRIAANAPAANVTLTVYMSREAYPPS